MSNITIKRVEEIIHGETYGEGEGKKLLQFMLKMWLYEKEQRTALVELLSDSNEEFFSLLNKLEDSHEEVYDLNVQIIDLELEIDNLKEKINYLTL